MNKHFHFWHVSPRPAPFPRRKIPPPAPQIRGLALPAFCSSYTSVNDPGKKKTPHIKTSVPVTAALPPSHLRFHPSHQTEALNSPSSSCTAIKVKLRKKLLPLISQSSAGRVSTSVCFQGLQGTAETFKTLMPCQSHPNKPQESASHFSSPAARSSVHVQALFCGKQPPAKMSFAKVTKI